MDKFWLKSYPEGVPAEIDFNQYGSLIELLDESFQKYADRKACICMDKSLTYGEVDVFSRELGAWLQSIGFGQRRARGLDDAERLAISDCDCRRSARWLCRRQR